MRLLTITILRPRFGMGRQPCCEKVGLRRGQWKPEEDKKLLAYIDEHGPGGWRALPAKAGLLRCGKSCRLRWANYLRADIKRGKFSLEEEKNIIQLHALLGNKWSVIATHLPKRTDNEIKNYWNTHIKKQLAKDGIDPVTHKPMYLNPSTAKVSHIAQWESARLEAEERLVLQSNIWSLSSTQIADPSSQTLCSNIPKSYNPESSTSTRSFSNIVPLSIPAENPTSILEENVKEETNECSSLDDVLIDDSWTPDIVKLADGVDAYWQFPRLYEGFSQFLPENVDDQNSCNGGGAGGDDSEHGNYWTSFLDFS
ncbi:hypothetical protein GIB67_007347 [Kingdonia uniflora]|uniref:Uncharacterized protein n=1 Tax=Kingdonia uniflora TaxID=39325 RepID=A0A7J7NX93_9MAGN|nr:hypothetical protein GIB67_007347 [Kingdonia uniflora]